MKVLDNMDDTLIFIQENVSIVIDKIADMFGTPNWYEETWHLVGIDELDEIEIIMYLESKCDCLIRDDVAEKLFRTITPSQIKYEMIAQNRQDKIDKIVG